MQYIRGLEHYDNARKTAVTFGKFFKERQEVGIHADDLGLGIDKVFYLIVDKDKTDENVYLLTEVGENDLLNFTDTNMVTLPQNQAIAESALPLETEKITETPEPEVTIIPEEKEEPEKKSNNSGTILLMLLVLAGVCGAYYYWKFMKGRNTSFDYEEDEDDDEEEEDTIREDDEELEEYEMEGEVEDEESEE